MTLFGGIKPRTTIPGVMPYFPTPEEQATAIPGRGQMLMGAASAGGMFGRGPSYQTPGIGDGMLERNMGPQGGVLSNAITSALG